MTRLTDDRIRSVFKSAVGGICGSSAITFARAIEAELSKQEPVARPRLPRIDHFAREAFEKFASGVECELTNYRWFEAGWDARGDTVAAAPLPSAPDTVQVPPSANCWLNGGPCIGGRCDEPRFCAQNDTIAAAPKSTP